MAVFNADILTPLAVADSGTDHKLPPPASLDYGGITGLGALAGTNGVDTLLVAGDRDRQMNGNERTRISQNRSHTVKGNQDKKVVGNKLENVIGNFAQTTIGNLHRSIIGATNELFTAAHAIEHKANQMVEEPVTYFHHLKEKYETNDLHMDVYNHALLYCNTLVNVLGTNSDFKGLQTAAIGAGVEKTGFSWAEHIAKINETALDHRIEALDSKIGAIQPVVHVTMLHEVAITQKILVIGVNQYI